MELNVVRCQADITGANYQKHLKLTIGLKNKTEEDLGSTTSRFSFSKGLPVLGSIQALTTGKNMNLRFVRVHVNTVERIPPSHSFTGTCNRGRHKNIVKHS